MSATCPKPPCEQNSFANPGTLAAHLVDAHTMAGSDALLLARRTFGITPRSPAAKPHPPSADSTDQPNEEPPTMTCTTCSKAGHRKDSPEFHPKTGTKPGGGGNTVTTPRAAKKRKGSPVRSKAALVSASNGTALSVAKQRVDEELVDARAEVRALERIAARLTTAGA